MDFVAGISIKKMNRFIKKTADAIHHSYNVQRRTPYFALNILLTHKFSLPILPTTKSNALSIASILLLTEICLVLRGTL